MRPHKKMAIWNEAMELTEEIYKATAVFPKDEAYGISSQIKRAAISIASNIAEGCARESSREKKQFFIMSRGSASELDAQLEICLRLAFINQDSHNKLNQRLETVSRMLQGLVNSQRLKLT